MSNLGKLVIFEGSDMCGKTTQLNYLKNLLKSNGKSVATFKYPLDSKYGRNIYKLFGNKKISVAERNYKLMQLEVLDKLDSISVIVEAMKKNDYVLLDRYVLSQIIYDTARYRLYVKSESVFLDDIDYMNRIISNNARYIIDSLIYAIMTETNEYNPRSTRKFDVNKDIITVVFKKSNIIREAVKIYGRDKDVVDDDEQLQIDISNLYNICCDGHFPYSYNIGKSVSIDTDELVSLYESEDNTTLSLFEKLSVASRLIPNKIYNAIK